MSVDTVVFPFKTQYGITVCLGGAMPTNEQHIEATNRLFKLAGYAVKPLTIMEFEECNRLINERSTGITNGFGGA